MESSDIDASQPPEDASAQPETPLETGPEREFIPEPIAEANPEPPESVVETAPEPEPEPKTCQPGEACNALLLQDGKCPGRCIPQNNKVQCRGKVVHGLCYRNPPTLSNQPATIKGILFEPGPLPSLVQEGETKTFTIKATNTQNNAVSLLFSYTTGSSWQLLEASFKDLASLEFKANEVKVLTMKMLATKADIFTGNLSGGRLIAFSFNRDSFALFASVGYAADGNVACGKHYFPAKYCPTSPCTQSRSHYTKGMCCDEVFYPGVQCCTSSDCQDGGCFDGVCVSVKPRGLANTLPTGHERILVVLSDFQDITHDPSKVCTNRFTELKARLKIADFEAYYNKLSQQFTGRPGPQYQWVVLAGINTADFNPNGVKTISSMHSALQKYLISKGCIKSATDFDKRLLISPNLDLSGFTGYAISDGRLAMKKIDMYLFAHELTHTYGAQDLYLNLGGKLQYLFDLMGNNLGRYGIPEFGVSWGEIMWGDTNNNGVIDVFEFASYPDSLIAINHTAQLTSKNTIEVGVDVAAMEAGVQKRILLHRFEIELPDYKAKTTSWPGRVSVFSSGQVDLDDIRQKGSVKVRVIATYTYTDKNFQRKELKLSSDKVVTVAN